MLPEAGGKVMDNIIDEFDILPDGQAVHRLWLRSSKLTVAVLTLGATVQDLRLGGVSHPLVLGYDDAATYLAAGRYVGAIVGRFANRIAQGRFALDGVEHVTDPNEATGHTLHGGTQGTHAQVWRVLAAQRSAVTMGLTLADGHMGFPGKVDLTADFSVRDSALSITLTATTDAATPLSLAHHGYFTLDDTGDVRGHTLKIQAKHYLPVSADLIPTGQIAPVADTIFDFRPPRPIGAGYDHNFCLSNARVALRPVAVLAGQGGVSMQVETTEPGLQLFDGRSIKPVRGLENRIYGPYAGVALETQAWPDAPNQPGFPNCILRPDQTYCAQTVFRFSGP